MLAIFRQELAQPPKELNSPTAAGGGRPNLHRPEQPELILAKFLEKDPENAATSTFSDGAATLAYIRTASCNNRIRFCGMEDVYCLFSGRLDNLSSLIRQYGLSNRSTDEALFVIEAYRTLRDRGPYPADQVIRDLTGEFAFVVFDRKCQTVFASASAGTSGLQLYWGIAAEGSVVISDDLKVVKSGCGKSFAPFPAGCMFHGRLGLQSFEHPMKEMKPMPRVDSEGVMCGATFKVDEFSNNNNNNSNSNKKGTIENKYYKSSSMPRVGSEANWAPSWN